MTRRKAHDPPRPELRWPRFVREQIAERIAITGALITLAFTLAIGAISLAYTLHLTREAAHSRLEEDTRDAANQLSQLIDGALGDIRLLAGNPTVIDSLAAGRASQGELGSLLASFHPAGREPVVLCAAGAAGRILACDRSDLTVDPIAVGTVSTSPQFLSAGELLRRDERPQLRLTAPVFDPHRRLLGFVVGEYAIERLIISALGNPANYFHLHLVGANDDLYVRGSVEQTTIRDRPLDLDPTLRGLALRLHLGIDESMIWNPMRNVLLVYLAVLASLLPLVYLAARKSGYALSARLRGLAAATRSLASGGSRELSADHYGNDEVGDLARAFGEVVGELRQSRADLETRIERRTHELQASLDEVRALSTAIGQSAVSVIITDLNGAIRFVNADFERVTGYQRQEIVGQTARILKSGRTLPFEYGSLWATITAGKVWRGEFENRRKDGSHYFAQASIAPIRNDAGDISGFVAVEEDITERKQFEREIRDRENYLRTLVDSLPDTLLVLDHAGRIQQLRAPDAHLGSAPGTWTSDWCLGRHYVEVLPREIAAPIGAILPEILQGPEHREFSYTIRHGGEKRHYAASIRRIDDEQPARAGCVILSRDVSEAFALQAKLIRAEARFRTLLENIDNVAVQGYDRRRQVIFWNRASERLYGWRSDEAIGRRLEDLIIADEFREAAIAAVRAAIETGRPIPPGEHSFRRKDGSTVYVYTCSAVQTNLAGEPEMFCVDIDLTERRRAEARMRQALVVFNASSQGIMTTDQNGIVTSINPAFTVITGYGADEVIGNRSSMFKSGRHEQRFYDEMWAALKDLGRWEGEIWNRRRNGELYPQWLNISAVRDDGGQVAEYVAMFSDISLRKQQEEMIWRQANFDALTGLANRNLLGDRLERAIAQARRKGHIAGVLFLDLDGFKAVNDQHGHAVGDELLVDTARRLAGCVREQDTVARMGGDEFTLVIHDALTRADLPAIGNKVVAALREPFHLSTGIAHVSGSVGIAAFPEDGDDAETLLRRADAAMYTAKGSGKNRIASFQGAAEEEPKRDS